MSEAYATWDEWLRTLDETSRERALRLADGFRVLGADDPERWARSEVSEDIPQLARYCFLGGLWEHIMPWRSDDPPIGSYAPDLLGQLERSGITKQQVGRFVAAVVYEVVFGILNRIDEGYDPELPDDAPGWAVMERVFDPETEQERLTGRPLGGLHEDFLTMDPTGQEGRDLLARG